MFQEILKYIEERLKDKSFFFNKYFLGYFDFDLRNILIKKNDMIQNNYKYKKIKIIY